MKNSTKILAITCFCLFSYSLKNSITIQKPIVDIYEISEKNLESSLDFSQTVFNNNFDIIALLNQNSPQMSKALWSNYVDGSKESYFNFFGSEYNSLDLLKKTVFLKVVSNNIALELPHDDSFSTGFVEGAGDFYKYNLDHSYLIAKSLGYSGSKEQWGYELQVSCTSLKNKLNSSNIKNKRFTIMAWNTINSVRFFIFIDKKIDSSKYDHSHMYNLKNYVQSFLER